MASSRFNNSRSSSSIGTLSRTHAAAPENIIPQPCKFGKGSIALGTGNMPRARRPRPCIWDGAIPFAAGWYVFVLCLLGAILELPGLSCRFEEALGFSALRVASQNPNLGLRFSSTLRLFDPSQQITARSPYGTET